MSFDYDDDFADEEYEGYDAPPWPEDEEDEYNHGIGRSYNEGFSYDDDFEDEDWEDEWF